MLQSIVKLALSLPWNLRKKRPWNLDDWNWNGISLGLWKPPHLYFDTNNYYTDHCHLKDNYLELLIIKLLIIK